jgi:hypothetical protein
MTEKKRKPGRPKGSRNTRSGALRHCLRTGQTPVEFLTSIYQDEEQDLSVRMDAAKAVSPYVHARLQSVTVQEKPFEGDPNEFSNEYLAGVIARAGSSNAPAKTKGKRTTH